MDELSAKMVIYKIIAPSIYNRKGITRSCCKCGKEYTDNIDPEASHIICSTCSMGLADGVFVPKIKTQRSKRLGFIDVERRLKNGKNSDGS